MKEQCGKTMSSHGKLYSCVKPPQHAGKHSAIFFKAVPSGQGRKDDQDKPAWSLLPVHEVEDTVKVLTFGRRKYAAWNWQRVENGEERYKDAARRHLAEIDKGVKKDPETGFPHYAHAICSLLFAFWHSRNRRKA